MGQQLHEGGGVFHGDGFGPELLPAAVVVVLQGQGHRTGPQARPAKGRRFARSPVHQPALIPEGGPLPAQILGRPRQGGGDGRIEEPAAVSDPDDGAVAEGGTRQAGGAFDVHIQGIPVEVPAVEGGEHPPEAGLLGPGQQNAEARGRLGAQELEDRQGHGHAGQVVAGAAGEPSAGQLEAGEIPGCEDSCRLGLCNRIVQAHPKGGPAVRVARGPLLQVGQHPPSSDGLGGPVVVHHHTRPPGQLGGNPSQ